MLRCRDPKQVTFVRAFGSALEELRKYVMQWHTTGVAWDPNVGQKPNLVCFGFLLSS